MGVFGEYQQLGLTQRAAEFLSLCLGWKCASWLLGAAPCVETCVSLEQGSPATSESRWPKGGGLGYHLLRNALTFVVPFFYGSHTPRFSQHERERERELEDDDKPERPRLKCC